MLGLNLKRAKDYQIMLVIYDLDKTTLYCPLSYKLDNCVTLKKYLGKTLFYSLYTPVYIIELIFGLFKTNTAMYNRAVIYDKTIPNVEQIVVTARHKSLITLLHKKLVFKDLNKKIGCIFVATGRTNILKVNVIKSIYSKNINCIIYDDNLLELANYKQLTNASLYKVYFDGKQEVIYNVN